MRARACLLGFSLVVSLVACSGSSDTAVDESAAEPAAASQSSTLRVGWLTDGLTGTVKDLSDEFSDTAYRLEWVEFDSSASMVEALSAGAIDVAVEAQVPISILAQGNAETAWTAETAPMKIIAAWEYSDNPGFALMVKDTSIADASGLAGKKVAFSRGTMAHAFWTILGNEYDLSTAEAAIMPAPEGRAALQAGAVDGLITAYGTALALEEKGAGKIIDNSSRSLGSYCVSLARSAVLEDDQMVADINDFLARFGSAYEGVIANLDPAISREMDKLGVSRSVAEKIVLFKTLSRVPIDEPVLEVFRKVSDAFVSSGVITQSVDSSLLVDGRFDGSVLLP